MQQRQPTQLSFDTMMQEQERKTQRELYLEREARIAEQRAITIRAAEQQLREQQEAVTASHEIRVQNVMSSWQNDLLTLRPYQHDGRIFLRDSERAMCTLPPGLGKTETAISACLADDGITVEGPVGICCPGGLTDMWFDRILKYLPNAKIVEVSGTRRQRTKALQWEADWYIFNYEMLHSKATRSKRLTNAQRAAMNDGTLTHDDYIDIIEEEQRVAAQEARKYDFPTFKRMIFDESHHLKSHDSKRAQAAAETARDRDMAVYLLSGTPIKRDPDDLYMQCHILMPHTGYNKLHPDLYFSEYESFVRQYCVSLPSPYGSKVYGARKKPIEELMEKVSFFVSYEDADVYRPPIEEQTINVRMDDKHEDAYNAVERAYMYDDITFHSAMEVMHALRAVTFTQGKLDRAIDIVDDLQSVYDPQHPDQVYGCVFFTIYQQSAHMIANALNEHLGYAEDDPRRIIPLTGETDVKERSQTLDDLIQRRAPIIVGTLGTISEGKDLSYMKAVVFLEETWTHMEIEQGIDRVRRAGSTETKVNVYYIHSVHKGNGAMTVDGEIHNVQDHRGMTAELIVRRIMDKARARHKKQLSAGATTS